ncbi:MAG: hypothetical protein HYZ66_08670 [Chlamydiae bacterium]|nr:hypothetical protein [Chlamydiota bacterium]
MVKKKIRDGRLQSQFQVTEVASWTLVATLMGLVQSGLVKVETSFFLTTFLLAFLVSSVLLHHVFPRWFSVEKMRMIESFNFFIFSALLIHLTGGSHSPFWLLSYLPIMISLGLLQTTLSFWILSLTVALCLLEMGHDYLHEDLSQLSIMILNIFSLTSLTTLGYFLMRTVVQERKLKDLALGDREIALKERDRNYQLLQERQGEVEEFSRRLSDINQELMTQQTQLLHITEDLEQTNRELKKIDRMKSDFVSMVSHELKTPLTVIKESIALLLEDAASTFSAEQQKFLNITSHNTERLSHLIQDILDFSKLESKKMKMKKEKVKIEPIFSLLWEQYKRMAEEKKIKLTFSSEDSLEVYADPGRLRQILDNFLSNAFKFTPLQGSIEIEASLTDREWVLNQLRQWRGEEMIKNFDIVQLMFWKQFVVLGVKDSGQGIARADIPKIFEKFFQLDHQEARPRGTGLGLAIVKELVLAHQGAVWVESEIGKGTTFKVGLPVFQEAVQPILALNQWLDRSKQLKENVMFMFLDFRRSSEMKKDFQERMIFLDGFQELLKSSMNHAKDTVARIGTDQFLMGVLEARHDQMFSLLEKIQKGMREKGWGEWESMMRYHLQGFSYDKMNDKSILEQFDNIQEQR